ncbi:MAG: hypothetical protein QNK37_33190 [Acidobacteriota bacterium]|nr:hypothetical protein [Acidobacteriota bacterium]
MENMSKKDLIALASYLKEEVSRLEEENARLSVIAAEPLQKAEEILIEKGRSLAHKEIRELLTKSGVAEPVVEHVISQVGHVLKKVKKGSVLDWASN